MSRPFAFDPLEVFGAEFKRAGTVAVDRCPVCGGGDTARLWQLPQSRLAAPTYLNSPGSPWHDLYLDYLPLLSVPQEVFIFDICHDCHSVFRNPADDDHSLYVRDRSKVEAFEAQGTAPFNGAAETCMRLFPPAARVVVDAACGSGQILAILRNKHPDLRLMGLELSRPSVDFLNSLGIPAAAVDLDFDDLDAAVAPGSVDFIAFIEAFEHVRRPLGVLKKLVRMLRPGGRIHFTAQFYGENGIQIRVGEPIYIDRHGLDWIVSQLDAKLYKLTADIKLRITLEKS